MPVLLSSREGRSKIVEALHYLLDTNIPGMKKAIEESCPFNPPETPAARQEEYEKLVELIVISNAKGRLRALDPELPLTGEEEGAILEAFAEASLKPQEHYRRFAEKVFSQTEWETEPRLFLDELLSLIRQKTLS